jgi:hypothetical protein
MDPEGWNLIAMTAIHQGAGECAIKNCKACNYQPEADKPSDAIPLFFSDAPVDALCVSCAAVERGTQIVCPQHSVASDIFMVHADKEAHLTLEDQPLTRLSDLAGLQAQQAFDVDESELTGLPAIGQATAQHAEDDQQITPTKLPDGIKPPESNWESLSEVEQEIEIERVADETRKMFLDSNLCSDIP